MCGIIGYVGKDNASRVCYEGLKRLEYRGYDSAGIAVLSNEKLRVYKRSGKVANIEGACLMGGSCGIGHTRWATHGVPDERNAHPHISGRFAVVHNGIIENFAELKNELTAEGYVFLSDTDSEAAAHLINKYFRGNPLEAVKAAVSRLKGSYALCVLCEGFDCLIAAKRRSPLIIGFGEDENFVASDIPALSGRAGEFCVLADGDCALVTKNGARIFGASGKEVKRRKKTNPVGAESITREGYPHFMLKEIHESPEAIRRTAESFFKLSKVKLKKLFSGAREIIITGCGTAFNSGLAAKEYFLHIAHIPCRAEIASEFRYSRPEIDAQSLVIAVSQSGETADTVEAAKLARRKGARVIAVTNVPYSAAARAASFCVPICAGTEVCVAATKSYVAQIAALYLLANFCAGKQDAARQELLKTAAACKKLLNAGENFDGCAREIQKSSAVFFIGRGADYAAAREGSLKLKEVSYVFSDGYAAGELKHGTLALIDGSTSSVIITTQSRLAEKCLNAAEQIASRGGKIYIIATAKMGKLFEGLGSELKIPAVSERLAIIPAAIACQLIAYKTAVYSGRNPDKPRNLAKSVTVE